MFGGRPGRPRHSLPRPLATAVGDPLPRLPRDGSAGLARAAGGGTGARAEKATRHFRAGLFLEPWREMRGKDRADNLARESRYHGRVHLMWFASKSDYCSAHSINQMLSSGKSQHLWNLQASQVRPVY